MTSSVRFVDAVRERIASVIPGRELLIERLLIALFTGGHVLLRGQSGVGKSLVVHALARALGLHFGRLQCTRDLLPEDIAGSEFRDDAQGRPRTSTGPIFTNLFFADEFDHAAPKVQTFVLEAMQNRHVIVGDSAYLLPAPFMVVATQSAGGKNGSAALSDSQLDQFLLCHRVECPDMAQEEEAVRRNLSFGLRIDEHGAVPRTSVDLLDEPPITTSGELVETMTAVQRVYVSEVLTRRAVELVRRTRQHRMIELGAGPRASIALTVAARARALIAGRDHTIPDDLHVLAEDVLSHRVRLSPEALADGRNAGAVLREILGELG